MLKLALLFCALAAPPALADEAYTLTTGETVAPLETFQECAVCPEMIVMPLGSFMMGAIEGESDNTWRIFGEDAPGGQWGPDEVIIIPLEHPRHRVEIDMPFAMGRNEVTIGEWMHCVEAGACSTIPLTEAFTTQPSPNSAIDRVVYVPMGPDHPASEISFLDMQEYVAWLNSEVGAEVYRLPTEAEWEYAARAGTETRFAQGDFISIDQANYDEFFTAEMLGLDQSTATRSQMSVEVHALDAANDWGLRHMSGNLIELTLSRHTPRHLGLATSSAYLEHALADFEESRVGKGGGYSGAMDYLRLAFRFRPNVDFASQKVGFRVLREM